MNNYPQIVSALLLLTLLIPNVCLSQMETQLTITVRNGFSEEPLDGVNVELARDGVVEHEATTGADGTVQFNVTVVATESEIPENDSQLGPAFPNPASGMTRIPLTTDHPDRYTVALYDALGRLVVSRDEDIGPGSSFIDVSPGPSASGSYFLTVRQRDALIGSAAISWTRTTFGAASIQILPAASSLSHRRLEKVSSPANVYQLRLTKDGFVEQSREITLTSESGVDAWLHVDPASVSVNGLAAYSTGDVDIPLLVAFEDGTTIVATRDSADFATISGAVLTQGSSSLAVEFAADGSPTDALVDDQLIVLGNLTDETVDVNIFTPDQQVLVADNVDIASHLEGFDSTGVSTTRDQLAILARGFTIASCAAQSAGDLSEVDLPLADSLCGSETLVTLAQTSAEAEEEAIQASGAAIATLGGSLDCSTTSVRNCLLGAVDIAGASREAFDTAVNSNLSEIEVLVFEQLIGDFVLAHVDLMQLPADFSVTPEGNHLFGTRCERLTALEGMVSFDRGGTFEIRLLLADSDEARFDANGYCKGASDDIILDLTLSGDFEFKALPQVRRFELINVMLGEDELPDFGGFIQGNGTVQIWFFDFEIEDPAERDIWQFFFHKE